MLRAGTDFMLGFKLARQSGVSRMAGVAGCSAVGIVLLLLCRDFPQAAHIARAYNTRDDRLFLRCLTLVVAMPVCFLISTVVRLSSDARDRRVATLRLMGLPTARAFRVVVVEVGTLVLCGGLCGVLLHLVIARPLYGWWRAAGFVQQHPDRHLVTDLATVLVVSLGSAALTARPAARSARKALDTVRRAGRSHRRQLGAAALALVGFGLSLAANVAPHDATTENASRDMIFVALGMLCFGLGLAALAQTLLRVVATVLRRRNRAQSVVMAARLEGDRAAFGRALGGLVLSTYLVSTGLCVFTAWKSTPQYVSTEWAVHHETSTMVAVDDGNLPKVLAEARSTPGISSANPVFFANSTRGGNPVVVLSCAQLTRFVGLQGCSDETPWTYVSKAAGSTTVREPVAVNVGGRVHHFTPAKKVLAKAPWPKDAWGLDYLSDGGVVVPPKVAAKAGLKPNSVLVSLAPGVHTNFDTTINGQPIMTGDWANYATVNRLQTFVFLLAAAVMLVGALTVVVATLDLLVARRRRVAALQVVGISAGSLRRIQWGATALPILIAIVVAVGAGMLTGRGYLRFGGYPQNMPWNQLEGLLGIGIVAGALLALATGIGMARPLTTPMLRRE